MSQNDYIRIANMETSIGRSQIAESPNASGWHESLLRSYHIVQKVKWLLQQETNPKVVLELIGLMESPTAPAEKEG